MAPSPSAYAQVSPHKPKPAQMSKAPSKRFGGHTGTTTPRKEELIDDDVPAAPSGNRKSIQMAASIYSQPPTARKSVIGKGGGSPNVSPGKRRKTLTVRRPAIFNQAYSAGAVDEYKAKVTPKSDETRAQIKASMRQNPLFEHLPNELVDKIIDVMVEVPVEGGTTLIEQGGPGDNFYLVTEGSFTAHVKGVEMPVQKYGPGESFGELALLYNAPRAASVQTKAGGVVFALGRHAFRGLVQAHNTEAKVGLDASLKTVPMLKDLSEEQRARLVNAMEDLSFEEGDYIIETGEEADALFLIIRSAAWPPHLARHSHESATPTITYYYTHRYAHPSHPGRHTHYHCTRHDTHRGTRLSQIGSGEVACTRGGEGDEKKELVRLGQGQFFGKTAQPAP